MVGRDPRLVNIMLPFMRSGANLAFMRDQQIEDREKRLPRLPLFPLSFVRRFIPNLPRLHQVVIFLGVVRAVVTRFA